MANSADPDQLASSEANWSGLFAKAWYIRVQQDKGYFFSVWDLIVCMSFTLYVLV